MSPQIRQCGQLLNAPVAQLDRVPGFEPGGRGFESLRARHIYQQPTDSKRRGGMRSPVGSTKSSGTILNFELCGKARRAEHKEVRSNPSGRAIRPVTKPVALES